jgi:hypothetical protein
MARPPFAVKLGYATKFFTDVYKKAARSFDRAAPTLTSHYETRVTTVLSAVGPRQSMKHCTN